VHFILKLLKISWLLNAIIQILPSEVIKYMTMYDRVAVDQFLLFCELAF
jgi:hypothetical protein